MSKGSNTTRSGGAATRAASANGGGRELKSEAYIEDSATIANFGKPGTYTLYRAGGTESTTSALFFATNFSYADTYRDTMIDKQGNPIIRPANEYKVEIHNPLVVDGETNIGCTSEAYARLVGGKQPSSQLAKDRKIAAALKKSPYDAILYTLKGKPHEVIVPKRGSVITPTGRKLTSTPYTRLGYSGRNDYINTQVKTFMSWKNDDGTPEYTRATALARAIRDADNLEKRK